MRLLLNNLLKTFDLYSFSCSKAPPPVSTQVRSRTTQKTQTSYNQPTKHHSIKQTVSPAHNPIRLSSAQTNIRAQIRRCTSKTQPYPTPILHLPTPSHMIISNPPTSPPPPTQNPSTPPQISSLSSSSSSSSFCSPR